MSDNYIDPRYSEVARTRAERATVNVVLWNATEPINPSCPVCIGIPLISQENGTILFCPSCGTKTLTAETKFDSKVKARYGPNKGSKILIESQTQDQRRKKKEPLGYNVGDVEVQEGLTEEDKKDLGII
jgi:uncharacterized Zn finger protein (UPF0148 family)